MNKIHSLFASLVLFVAACNSDTVSVEQSEALEGEWLLTEVGYSPGDSYITKPVSADPPQVLILASDSTMRSTLPDLEKFKYYAIVDDTVSKSKVIGFFELKTELTNKIDELQHSYSIIMEGSKLRLNYRYCIEGCHLGFKRH